MKANKILELIKLPEGAEIDLTQLDLSEVELEWNRQYNGMKKSVGEEASAKAVTELLKEYGLSAKEDIKALQDATITNEQKENEEINTLKTTLQTLQNDLKAKDDALIETNRKTSLGNFDLGEGKFAKIKGERIDKAYKLIMSEVSEENTFEDVAKKFITDTPEWVEGSKKQRVSFEDTKNENLATDEDATTLEGAW